MPVLVVGEHADTKSCICYLLWRLHSYCSPFPRSPRGAGPKSRIVTFTLEQIHKDTGYELSIYELDVALTTLACCDLVQFERESDKWAKNPSKKPTNAKKTLNKTFSINQVQAAQLKKLI